VVSSSQPTSRTTSATGAPISTRTSRHQGAVSGTTGVTPVTVPEAVPMAHGPSVGTCPAGVLSGAAAHGGGSPGSGGGGGGGCAGSRAASGSCRTVLEGGGGGIICRLPPALCWNGTPHDGHRSAPSGTVAVHSGQAAMRSPAGSAGLGRYRSQPCLSPS
jgi:hypothetical protein